jgi:hypothetical protein
MVRKRSLWTEECGRDDTPGLERKNRVSGR